MPGDIQRVAVSILNHQSANSTIACVQSLLTAGLAVGDRLELEIFVADNASGTAEQQELQRSLEGLSNVHFRINNENLGFSAGHNCNLRTVFAHFSPDYIWILNNDCMVEEFALVELLKCAQQNPDVGIWGATLLEADGDTIQCAGGCFYNSWLSSYRQYGRGRLLSRREQLKPVDYDYISGASLFFPSTTLQNGLRSVPGLSGNVCATEDQWLNENFFLYFEELDLAMRLKPGIEMAWCKDALITHAGGESTGTTGQQRSAQAEYHSTLSALKFTRLYYPGRFWLMAPTRYVAKCLQLSARRDFHLLTPLTRAYRDYRRWLTGRINAST